jgi:hypothetical protein
VVHSLGPVLRSTIKMSYPFYISGESTFQRYLIESAGFSWVGASDRLRFARLWIEFFSVNNLKIGDLVSLNGLVSNGCTHRSCPGRAPGLLPRPRERFPCAGTSMDGNYIIGSVINKRITFEDVTGMTYWHIQRVSSPSPRKPTLLSGAWIARPRL